MNLTSFISPFDEITNQVVTTKEIYFCRKQEQRIISVVVVVHVLHVDPFSFHFV